MIDEIFDYVVIGAGTTGCVVAGRLSESGKFRVCVLEAGPPDRNPFIHIPAGVLHTLRNPDINWMYKGAGSPGLAGRAINHARGRTLGGSGSINGHIYSRGQKADFDTWAQLGNRGWSYVDVLPYFLKSENKLGGGDDGYHGKGGAFTITENVEPDPLSDAFIDAAVNLGIPRNADYNGHTQEGVAYAQRSVHRGRRVSPARSFLHPAHRRGNTKVVTNAHVLGIEFDGARAIGARYQMEKGQNKSYAVRATREVILCAGAMGSPHILELSGIGKGERLQSLGINVVSDIPGVGENFRDHFAVRLVTRVHGIETINERARGLPLIREFIRYGLSRRGALSLTPTLVYCFWKSDLSLENGDIQITFTPASYPGGVQSGLDRFPGATIACWQQRPESSGYVHAVSPDPFVRPEIQGNYLAEQGDRRILLAAMKLSRQIMATAPFVTHVAEEIWPGGEKISDEDLLTHARETGNTAYHPMGTCRMGPADRIDSVVDDQLCVHGIEGLRIADASIMPTILSANLNAGALMIGEKAADMLIARA